MLLRKVKVSKEFVDNIYKVILCLNISLLKILSFMRQCGKIWYIETQNMIIQLYNTAHVFCMLLERAMYTKISTIYCVSKSTIFTQQYDQTRMYPKVRGKYL
jgi:uncharacterized protein YerC